MAEWQIVLMIFGGLCVFILFCFVLFIVGWGLFSAYIYIFSDEYFSGLKNMLDDLKYCRSNVPKIKNELEEVRKILKQCPKNNEYKQNTKF